MEKSKIKDITNKNQKRQFHGYQEWYITNGKLWLKGKCVNDRHLGYVENNETKRAYFYII